LNFCQGLSLGFFGWIGSFGNKSGAIRVGITIVGKYPASASNWVNDIAKDMFDVPHLHHTLTTNDFQRPIYCADRSLLKLL
jgi:hypothetical protein